MNELNGMNVSQSLNPYKAVQIGKMIDLSMKNQGMQESRQTESILKNKNFRDSELMTQSVPDSFLVNRANMIQPYK